MRSDLRKTNEIVNDLIEEIPNEIVKLKQMATIATVTIVVTAVVVIATCVVITTKD